jgi:hypothetical protein
MKTFSKPLLTICLISVTSMVFASQVPCPPAEVVAAYADRIDTVQGLGYDHFAVMMGTDQFENNFYDISSNLYWRLMAVVGVENAKAPALNQAYRQGKKLIHDVTTNMNKYAEEDGKVYLCTYGRGSFDDKVAAFSVINEGQTNSQLMKTLAAHTR